MDNQDISMFWKDHLNHKYRVYQSILDLLCGVSNAAFLDNGTTNKCVKYSFSLTFSGLIATANSSGLDIYYVNTMINTIACYQALIQAWHDTTSVDGMKVTQHPGHDAGAVKNIR